MKTILFIILSSITARAQNESTPDEFLRARLRALNLATYQLGQTFANDPRFEVTETQDTITVKRKTDPTIDPLETEELRKVDNLQQLIGFSLGFSSNSVPKRYFNNFPVRENAVRMGNMATIDFELVVRPPVKSLKRLAVGYGTGAYSNERPDVPAGVQIVSRGDAPAWYHAAFASWDVLILQKARAFVSTGYKFGRHHVTDRLDNVATFKEKQSEHTGTIRWTQFLGRDFRTRVGAQLFVQYGRTLNGANVVSAGLTYMFGPDWPFMKRNKTK